MGFLKRAAGSFDANMREKLLGIAAMDMASAKFNDRVYLAAILAELGRLNDNLEQAAAERQPTA